MKKVIVFALLLFCTFFYTCKKDAGIEKPVRISSPSSPIDTIIYTDIPDISLISYTTMHPSGCGIIPVPDDTIVSDSIDIDLDGVYDLKFTNSHTYTVHSASSPCVNYNCQIYVSALNKSDTIPSVVYYWIPDLYLNDTISNELSYSAYPISKLLISYESAYSLGPPSIHNFTGEKYVGLKMFRNGKTMFAWVRIESIGYNGVIIKDFAVNKTDAYPIFCGQK